MAFNTVANVYIDIFIVITRLCFRYFSLSNSTSYFGDNINKYARAEIYHIIHFLALSLFSDENVHAYYIQYSSNT